MLLKTEISIFEKMEKEEKKLFHQNAFFMNDYCSRNGEGSI